MAPVLTACVLTIVLATAPARAGESTTNITAADFFDFEAAYNLFRHRKFTGAMTLLDPDNPDRPPEVTSIWYPRKYYFETLRECDWHGGLRNCTSDGRHIRIRSSEYMFVSGYWDLEAFIKEFEHREDFEMLKLGHDLDMYLRHWQALHKRYRTHLREEEYAFNEIPEGFACDRLNDPLFDRGCNDMLDLRTAKQRAFEKEIILSKQKNEVLIEALKEAMEEIEAMDE